MTRTQLRQAILKNLEAGHLSGVASFQDLGDAVILAEQNLAHRLPPLKSRQKRAGIEPLTKASVHQEILKEFQRLFDQLKTPRRAAEAVAVRYDPAVGLVDGEPS